LRGRLEKIAMIASIRDVRNDFGNMSRQEIETEETRVGIRGRL
jgi:hypothetical protein